ncbi:MAG TPA: bifunctional polysaccharide deacetylase/glycosyltransferase family 2 protein [Streptosporangiaceae bacterium]|nr:bifunctional polysaccharide deacetylase/glycosyltransferase family 2 protein [Streptosporangiaceae bacterium]
MTAPGPRRRRRRPAAAQVERHREPRGHWGVVALFLAAVAVALLLNGFAEHTVGGARTAPPDTGSGAGSGLSDSRPVLDLSRRPARALGMPARTVALTFDDGPDPRWTPRVLDVLRRHHARATFFMIGSRVAERPDIARRVLREGHEIGSHTYTHADIGSTGRWRGNLELGLTQSAISGATGVKVRLIRPPYSSVPSALQGRIERSVRTAGDARYLVVLADHDTQDWARPGTGRVLAAATPRGGAGAVVMMHDGGGDRTQTVAALDMLLTRLQNQGYRFTTVTGGLGLPRGDSPAPVRDQVTGTALVTSQRVANVVAAGLSVLLVATAALIAVRLVMLPVFAGAHARRARRRRRVAVTWTAPVSIVVPAYNEEAGIAPTIRSLVRTSYAGAVEVIVVDDGSTDRTADVAAGLGLPNVVVVRRQNGGKAAALNTGVAYARNDVVILVDADTIFAPETIGRLVAPLADPEVGAVAGSPRVGNRRKMLGRWQHLEYVMGSNLDRRMFDVLRCVPTIPGAIGAFRREALAAVGGISTDTLAEDTDLTMSLWRANWRVVCEESASAWTEAPESPGQLWRQRYRWCYGTLQAMWKHRHALVERGRPGRFGRRALTHLALFQVALPLMSPVIDLFAVFGLVFLNPLQVGAVWLAFLGAQGLGAAYALRLAGEPLRYLLSLPAQQILYRQLMYLAVIQSIVTALLGTHKRWHVNRRFGTFREPATAGAGGRGDPEG